MRRIYRLLVLFFVALALVGCASSKSYYFYSKLNSTDLTKDSVGFFVFESDAYKVLFRASGLDLTLKAIVINNTNQLIKVDWDQSVIRINDFQERYIADMPGSPYFDKAYSLVPPLSTDSFILLQSGRFDMRTIDQSKLNNKQIVLVDQQTRIKSIRFDQYTSPLYFSIMLSLDIMDKQELLYTSFFIDRISNLDKKMYRLAKSQDFSDTNGFYSTYAKRKNGTARKIGNAVFEQLITTTIFSLICGKLVVSPEDCDDEF